MPVTRLPGLRREDLEGERLAVYESVCRVRGNETLDEDGGLVGPFNALVYAPEIGGRMLDLLNALNSRTSLGMRTTELVILTVGAHWKAEFEWWAHARRALECGLPAPVIDAIGSERTPDFESPEDGVVYSLARQLVETGRIDDATYAAGERVLGRAGVVELVSLSGYYTLISFLLNSFDVQLPPGEQTRWAQ
jgi:4-carboxymuconolactone decarboxylase